MNNDASMMSRDQMLERPLPNSAEAERAILGAIILDNALAAQAYAKMKSEMFYVPTHRYIFDAMSALMLREVEINPITIGEELRRKGYNEAVGGQTFVSNLTYGLPHFANINHYAKIVRDKYMLRLLVKKLNTVTSSILEEEDLPEELLKSAEREVVTLVRSYDVDRDVGRKSFRKVAEKVKEIFANWKAGKTYALRTGIPELDAKLRYGGLSKGDLIYVGAPPSRGKTALVLQIAINVAKRGHRVLIFSLEMKDTSLFMRALAGEAWVEGWKIRPDMFEYEDTVNRLRSSFETVAELKIDVDDMTRSLAQFIVTTRDAVQNDETELVIGDYLQLFEHEEKSQSREREVAKISSTMKATFKSLNIPGIVTTQLTIDASMNNKKPELENMRDSKQLGMDADVVLFPYGAAIGDEDKDGVRQMKIFCAKQREGQAGWEIDVDFDTNHQRFFTSQMYNDEQQERRLRGELAAAQEVEAEIVASDVVIDATLDDINFNE
jgi:replicative DNA helicase